MKAKIIPVLTLALLPAAVFTFTSCSPTSKAPPPVGSARIDYTKGVPGGVVVQTFKATATVTAIDPAQRRVTLLGADAKKFTVQASPEVTNFDQLRVGERVSATVVQKIVARLDKDDAAASEGTPAGTAPTAKDDQAGELMPTTAPVTAKVVAINSEKRTATLRFENGTTEIIPVRDDLDLTRRRVGEQVLFRVTEMIAIRLEKR